MASRAGASCTEGGTRTQQDEHESLEGDSVADASKVA